MPVTLLIFVVMIFVLNLALIAWALNDLLQRENVKYLSKKSWIFVMCIVFFGSVIYLLAGRGEDQA